MPSIASVVLATAIYVAKRYFYELLILLVAGIGSYLCTVHYIPRIAPILFDRNLYGMDINKSLPSERTALREKKGKKKYADLTTKEKTIFIPESLGILAGVVYLSVLLLLIVCLQVNVVDFSVPIASISVMLLLGFVDDVLGMRWGHKILLSALGTLPLALSFDMNSSTVAIPKPVLDFFLKILPSFAQKGFSFLNQSMENTTMGSSNSFPSQLSRFSASDFPSSSLSTPVILRSSGEEIEMITPLKSFFSFFLFGWWNSIASLYERVPYLLAPRCHYLKPNMVVFKSESSVFLLDNTPLTNDTKFDAIVAPLWNDTTHIGGTTAPSSPKTFPAQCLFYLGPFYLLYIIMLCIFCTNSINILAGVNGIEVGQSIIIAVASVIYNLLQYRLDIEMFPAEPRSVSTSSLMEMGIESSDVGNSAIPHANLDKVKVSFSLHSMQEREQMAVYRLHAMMILVPFIGVSLALWRFNRYPSRVFVGDSYTYFSGTVLAVACISGHYSKTLLLFFVPQFLNFFMSLPQLLGFVHCPPHRVPRWNPKTNKLTSSGNYTFLNAILFFFGGKDGMSESTLTNVALLFQALFCLLGFAVRFGLSSRLYAHVD